jgi:hypothetical protein
VKCFAAVLHYIAKGVKTSKESQENKMKNLRTLALIVTVLTLSIVASAQKTSDVIVKSTIADADANFTPLSIQSDLAGTYIHGTASVVSRIQGIGDWEMSTLSSPTRRVYVNFDGRITNPTSDSPQSGYHPVRFITQCVYGTSLLSLTSVGQTARCGLIVRVEIANQGVFSVRFYNKNFPGSDDIIVACTAVTSGKCNAWQTQSQKPDNDGKLTAQVFKVDTVKGKQVLTDYGFYRFSFDMSFVK